MTKSSQDPGICHTWMMAGQLEHWSLALWWDTGSELTQRREDTVLPDLCWNWCVCVISVFWSIVRMMTFLYACPIVLQEVRSPKCGNVFSVDEMKKQSSEEHKFIFRPWEKKYLNLGIKFVNKIKIWRLLLCKVEWNFGRNYLKILRKQHYSNLSMLQ